MKKISRLLAVLCLVAMTQTFASTANNQVFSMDNKDDLGISDKKALEEIEKTQSMIAGILEELTE